MKIEIPLPSIAEQQAAIYEAAIEAAIDQLRANLRAPRLPGPADFEEGQFQRSHLLREQEGWEPPSPEVVEAYFRHFQMAFPDYGTDIKLGRLLGLRGQSADRRIREYKAGTYKVPYGVWRHFLVLTGRVPQDIIPVLAFMA
jgi:hypothetical protein